MDLKRSINKKLSSKRRKKGDDDSDQRDEEGKVTTKNLLNFSAGSKQLPTVSHYIGNFGSMDQQKRSFDFASRRPPHQPINLKQKTVNPNVGNVDGT